MPVDYNTKPDIEELMHYGVLGMKWGRTRARANSDSIHAARRRVRGRKSAIVRQEGKINTLQGQGKSSSKERADLKKMRANALKNPDRAIAARMTKGEKAASVIVGTLLMGPVGLGAATAGIAGTSARSRAIEQKLDKKKYDPKKR